MNPVHDLYMAAVDAWRAHRATSEAPLAISMSPAFHARIASDMEKHPAAGRADPAAPYPDKLAGLPIIISAGQAEDYKIVPHGRI